VKRNYLNLLPFPYPNLLFTYPNLSVSSFFLEGNAVLNESLHNNGGRLFSGRFQAETLLQAEAGYITPSRTYNNHLYFPYREHHYIVGGFFQKYIAQKYGLKKANAYFKQHSYYWYWPFFTNAPMSEVIGKDFEESIYDFSDHLRKLAKNFHRAEGKKIAESQFFMPLNRDKYNIFFLVNPTGRERNIVVNYDAEIGKTSKVPSTFLSGKLIKSEGKFYTQTSHSVGATKTLEGLFDEEAMMKEGSEGKVVQGYLSDGKCVYFDVSSSFDQPQLYVGSKFYAQVNSSVFIDKEDNLYYFVQKDDHRVLYKNHRSLISFEGYYSIVSDVGEDGSIYFIANSKLGSTLYAYRDGTITRVNRADNIVEAKLVDKNTFLLATITADNYSYLLSKRTFDVEVPYFEDLKVEHYKSKVLNHHSVDLEQLPSSVRSRQTP